MKTKINKLNATEKFLKQMQSIINNSQSKTLSDKIKRGLAYKKLLNDEYFIQRVISYKSILKEAEPTPLIQVIRNFSKEIDPELELMYWENMASLFSFKSENNPNLTISQKRLILKDILDFKHKKQLGRTRIFSDK